MGLRPGAMAKESAAWMCQCRVTHNYFLRRANMHFIYSGDDAAFLEEHREELKLLGCSEEEVLNELRRQRQERLKAPEETLVRFERIQKEYQKLHPAVYKLDTSFLHPDFCELVAELRKPHSASAIASFKSRKLLEEHRPGLWTFPVFSEAFCDLIEAELSNFNASGLPRTAPNSMNRFGVIMSELGFCEGLLDPLVFEYVNVMAGRLLSAFCETLDSYRAFTVLYEAKEASDKELATHYDNAEVTLNINIGGTWQGGNVVFYGLATANERPPTEVVLRRGHGVFHAGLELHRATPISQGRRHNLILWCRSSGIRNDLCPMCFRQPSVVPTNTFHHEGFTVPPCETGDLVRDMSTDDIYD
ncbi:unnamed protein product [Effrenium voratum]|nr:unnamed protein product [Effrenium voratum]